MTLRVLQISDCHLMIDPAAELKGIRTRDRLLTVIHGLKPYLADTERLIVSGDLTHDEQLGTYQALRELLREWLPRLRVIPGNHDERSAMREIFGEHIRVIAGRNLFVESVGSWKLIGLDSHLPRETKGEIGPEQLEWLREELESEPQLHTCLFVHHPPMRVNSPWLDQIGLVDAEALRELLRHFPQVRLVACGHVHQELTYVDDGLTIVTCPATGVQFQPHAETLVVDQAAPGFRILELELNGAIRTLVQRVV